MTSQTDEFLNSMLSVTIVLSVLLRSRSPFHKGTPGDNAHTHTHTHTRGVGESVCDVM